MDFLIVISSFIVVWSFIEIGFLISFKLATSNNMLISHNLFMWNLRIIALVLFSSSVFMINHFNFNIKEFLIMCFL
jgi:hypothetical protein